MTHKFPEPKSQFLPVGIVRRLAAVFYDSIICIALLLSTTGLYMLISNAIIGGDQYQAMTEAGKTIHDPLLSSILFITLFLFFGYFWTHNGQTLGMQVWHLRVQNEDCSRISWNQALLRFLMSIASIATCGLGYLWAIPDKKNRTWQCILSESEIVRIPKR